MGDFHHICYISQQFFGPAVGNSASTSPNINFLHLHLINSLFMQSSDFFQLTYELTYPSEKLLKIQNFSVKSFSLPDIRNLFLKSRFPGNPHKHCIFGHNKTRQTFSAGFHSLGYKDSNLEMTESESVALPFGDSPLSGTFGIIHESRTFGK